MVNSSELRQRKIDKQNVFSPENEAVEGDFSKEPLIDDNSKYKGKTSLVDTFKVRPYRKPCCHSNNLFV